MVAAVGAGAVMARAVMAAAAAPAGWAAAAMVAGATEAEAMAAAGWAAVRALGRRLPSSRRRRHTACTARKTCSTPPRRPACPWAIGWRTRSGRGAGRPATNAAEVRGGLDGGALGVRGRQHVQAWQLPCRAVVMVGGWAGCGGGGRTTPASGRRAPQALTGPGGGCALLAVPRALVAAGARSWRPVRGGAAPRRALPREGGGGAEWAYASSRASAIAVRRSNVWPCSAAAGGIVRALGLVRRRDLAFRGGGRASRASV